MGSNSPSDDVDDVSMEPDSGSRRGTLVEDPDHLSVSSRQRIRDQMHADIEAFLARGGQIQQLDNSMSAEKLRPH